MNKLRLFNDWWRNRKYLVFYLSLSLFFLLAVCSMHADVHGHGSCCSPGELGDGRPGWPVVVRGRAAAQGDTGRGRAHSADGRRPQQAAGGGHACPSRVEDREPGRNAHGPRGPRGDRGVGRWACWVAAKGGQLQAREGRRTRRRGPAMDELAGKSTGKRKTKGKQSNGDEFTKRSIPRRIG